MVTTTQVQPIPQTTLEDIGMTWHTDTDGSAYLVPELVNVSEAEAQAFYDASNILYDHFVEAAEHVINEKRYAELGIDHALISLIEDSWERDDWHLYGRFDLAGGLDGKPIKLIEFNADTPTSLYETAILQWALLKANNMDEAAQFNNIHTMLQENFRRLITKDQSDFATSYHSEKFLFSSIAGLDEDERTVRYLQHVAHEAGLFTDFCFLDEAGFLENQGVFNRDQQRADFWFKLFPWEDIASEEPELISIFQSFSQLNSTSIINPAYTLLFQSKGLLPILSELFPDSPYLLSASFQPIEGIAQVEKKLFGREGQNTRITDASGNVISETPGEYAHHPSIYQAYTELPVDHDGNAYQAGVFYAYEACGLGFRRGAKILDNMSKFVGHHIVKHHSD